MGDRLNIIETIKKNKYLQGLLMTLIFFVLLHLTFVGLFSDDEWFLDMISEAESLKSLLIERYYTWTSRLLTEALCFVLVRLPFVVWAILDILICCLLYHCLSVIVVNDTSSRLNIILFLVIACYPFMHMASAGWLSTTLNYLWPFTLALYAFTGAVRRSRGQMIPAYKYVLYILSAVFAVNCEMPAAYTLLIFIGIVGWNVWNKKGKKSIYEIAVILIAIGAIIFAFTCPGNDARTEVELRWMPEFPALNIIDKFRLCAVFVFEHFVAIPDGLFFIFSLMLCMVGILKGDKLFKKIIATIPLTIDVIFSLYYFIRDFILGQKMSYDFSFPAICPGGVDVPKIQYLELAGLFIYIIATIYILVTILADSRDKYLSVYSLGSGFAVRMSLMLSATMFISWHRTLIYFYFALVAGIVILWKEGFEGGTTQDYKLTYRLMRALIILSIVAGIVINLILTVGHQMRV